MRARAAGSPPRVWGNGSDAPYHLLLPPVHPHVCGETVSNTLPRQCKCGSPPRVWGNGMSQDPQGSQPRFTPTCVGKRTWRPARRRRLTVHPHVCGETSTSSPPMRPTARFTPTCVGKRAGSRRAGTAVAVHPHVCGETWVCMVGRCGHPGSPPRVWGNGGGKRCESTGERFTPTCVGKRPSDLFFLDCEAVHPHVCGETSNALALILGFYGSPPRVWGNGCTRGGPGTPCGSPPRVWGNGAGALHIGPDTPVHPHVCGETFCRCPRTCGVIRFTPTCVGKRCSLST